MSHELLSAIHKQKNILFNSRNLNSSNILYSYIDDYIDQMTQEEIKQVMVEYYFLKIAILKAELKVD